MNTVRHSRWVTLQTHNFPHAVRYAPTEEEVG